MTDPFFDREVAEAVKALSVVHQVSTRRPGFNPRQHAHWQVAQVTHMLSSRPGCPEPLLSALLTVREMAKEVCSTPLVLTYIDPWGTEPWEIFGVRVVLEAHRRILARFAPAPALTEWIAYCLKLLDPVVEVVA